MLCHLLLLCFLLLPGGIPSQDPTAVCFSFQLSVNFRLLPVWAAADKGAGTCLLTCFCGVSPRFSPSLLEYVLTQAYPGPSTCPLPSALRWPSSSQGQMVLRSKRPLIALDRAGECVYVHTCTHPRACSCTCSHTCTCIWQARAHMRAHTCTCPHTFIVLYLYCNVSLPKSQTSLFQLFPLRIGRPSSARETGFLSLIHCLFWSISPSGL